ncbi:hypothetical protein [Ferruginibacter sp.]|nr:hypothetical protein [Ferruginibacter sp.]
MTRTLFITLIVLQAFCNTQLYAQNISKDSLDHKIELYNKMMATNVLYLTTDKTLYLPTEVIWFAAYLIGDIEREDSLKPDILSITLLKENDTIVLRKSYLIKNNFCAGSLTLSDTISAGIYQLIACTNLVDSAGDPLQVFRTRITVKTTTPSQFVTRFNFSDSPNPDSLFIDAQVYSSDGSLKTNKSRNNIQYYFLNQRPHTTWLNQLGFTRLAIPMKEVQASNHILYTTTTFEGRDSHFNLHLPVQSSDSVRIRFFPEGGDLISGLCSRIAWEASLPDGQPVRLNALLLENGRIADTLQTDSLGIGLFRLQPQNNSVYTLKTICNDNVTFSQTFSLPEALPKGAVLEVAEAVANDTLTVIIHINGSRSFSLALTNMVNNATAISSPIPVEKNKKIKLPLNEIYKGLNIITLLDEQRRPIAERLFFAHFNSRNHVEIATDKTIYRPREKITANIALADNSKKSVAGIFTVACVHESRLGSDTKENIEAYYYIEHWLNTKNYNKPIAHLDKSKAYIEKLLLVKGWRRYIWQQLMQADEPIANNLHPTRINLKGKVQMYNSKRKINEHLSVLVRQDSSYNIFITDKDGYFSPKPHELLIKEATPPIRFQAFDNKKSDTRYSVTIADPMERLRSKYKYIPVSQYKTTLNAQSNSSSWQHLEGELFIKELERVVVTAKARYKAEGYGTNECGDYVCRFNFLNCPIHVFEVGNHPPAKGKRYYYEWPVKDPKNLPTMIYTGCQLDNIPGIYTAREFYGMDSARLEKGDEKSYLSTLFWKPFTEAAANRLVSFYTSDLPGTYKITIEGIASNGDLLFGEKIIMIKQE